MKKYYITTAIPYVNGNPHLGHAMDYLLADVLRRYMMMRGKDVRVQAGTDEHGSKIYKKAAEQNIPVQEFVDKNAKSFQDFIHSLDAEYTDYVRTTDEDHVRRCQLIWEKLSDHIYKDSYEGWYCEGCERFVTDKEYDENGGNCPDHNKPYQKLSEENYYLRIADFKDQIREVIEKDELNICPAFRKKEFLNLLDDMPDVSISRPKEQVIWGIPVPGDESQVMYVWIDALANYITVLGYPEKDITDSWPADVEIVGKDILRFHAGIWPAMLFALDLPMPKNILVHGFVTVGGQKMGKSLGNAIPPEEIIEKHGLIPFRYYFLRHGSTTDDVDFTWEKYEAAYNELANDLGNLVQRLATLCGKNGVNGIKVEETENKEFDERMEKFEFNFGFDILWGQIQDLNKRIDEEKPWSVAKEDLEKAKEILRSLVQDLVNICPRLEIFIPDTAKKIVEIFTAEEISAPKTPLFPKN
ncbi:MAG: methionine--tRNA ligase [Candidatus Saccharibacteria bacterium]|nr:methionine--tRNA ligase [Candidatus Saccharibacteria bacterium]